VNDAVTVHAAAGGWNAGFLRPSAALAVLYLSDEEDYSAGTVDSYVATLTGLRPGNLVTQGIIAQAGDPCVFLDATIRYPQLLAATGGDSSSICDASYAAELETFAGRVTGLQRHLTLTAPAPSGAASVVQIAPGGARSTLSQGSAWSWDATTNQVVLTATPASGYRFEVTYAPGCPDEPGDTGGAGDTGAVP
jgi:hypothetical protein